MLGIARYNNAGFLVLMPRSYVACRLFAQGIRCSPFLGGINFARHTICMNMLVLGSTTQAEMDGWIQGCLI